MKLSAKGVVGEGGGGGVVTVTGNKSIVFFVKKKKKKNRIVFSEWEKSLRLKGKR